MNRGMPTSNIHGCAYSELVPGSFDEEKAIAAAQRAHREIGDHASIAFLFVSCSMRDSLYDLVELVQIHARCPKVVGCSASGLISGTEEQEESDGFSLLVLRLPQTEIHVQSLSPEADDPSWENARRWGRQGCDGWVLLGHPAVLGEEWMEEWNQQLGPVPVYGGLAGGSHRADDIFLFDESGIHEDASAIAIGLRGGVQFLGLVSQGCRPIGEPLTITKADDNLIHQLAFKKAYDQLQSTYQNLSESLRERAQGNILIGLAMSEYVEDFNTGDFLIRSILGGDPDKGALAVGAQPRVGQTLQFQLRDRESAVTDLNEALVKANQKLIGTPLAVLLFSCAGRGKNLFGIPNHDATKCSEAFNQAPLSGFFCNGEIGSVGEKAFLHGFTASAVVLASKDE